MPPDSPAKMIETDGVSVVLRRAEGARARELFFLCEPPGDAGAGDQAEAAYRAILRVLDAEGGSFEDVVCERVFLRDVRADLERVRAARELVMAGSEGASHRPARTEIGQPPLDGARLQVAIEASLPAAGSPRRIEVLETPTACACAECARSHGLRIDLGEEVRLHAGALYGAGGDVYEQTLAAFGVAEALLRRAGLEFGDVARTWIPLREMDRDYADLNRARREFFEARGVDPAPASTGIGGGPVPREHDLCLGLYAVRGGSGPARTAMTTPTLNEAPLYGSDFARGMRIVETNKVALHVSGTASIDEAGRTAHVGDFEAQVDRMLVNVAALLEGQGATFGDVVSAVTYLKHPADAQRLREKFHEAGFEGFPNVLVAAPVCRPELLCETEVLAVLPKDAATPSGSA